jgi:SAM-dependent methyltransferase
MNTKQFPVELEEKRLTGVETIEDYSSFHERHRVFPLVFEDRGHHRILDSSAGVGCAAQRIRDNYPAELVCNDISPTCLRLLNDLGLSTVSFDLDAPEEAYPFDDGHFDAVISLATIEHLVHVDHFVQEIHRILTDGGYFYLSTPNYAGLLYFRRFVLAGRTFHNPLSDNSRYEFYAHLRYFTYRTLLEYVSSFGFTPDTVYLTLPEGSTRYKALYSRSPLKALTYRYAMKMIYTLFSPRWASEPIVCFRKGSDSKHKKPRKVVL